MSLLPELLIKLPPWAQLPELVLCCHWQHLQAAAGMSRHSLRHDRSHSTPRAWLEMTLPCYLALTQAVTLRHRPRTPLGLRASPSQPPACRRHLQFKIRNSKAAHACGGIQKTVVAFMGVGEAGHSTGGARRQQGRGEGQGGAENGYRGWGSVSGVAVRGSVSVPWGQHKLVHMVKTEFELAPAPSCSGCGAHVPAQHARAALCQALSAVYSTAQRI